MNTLSRLAVWMGAFCSLAYLGAWACPWPVSAGGPDLRAFAALPIQDGGRIKPIDSLARTTLTTINSRQNFVHSTAQDERSHSSIEWLLDVWGEDPFTGPAANYPVFRITDLQLLDYFRLPQRPLFWRYSPAELKPRYDQFERDINRLGKKQKEDPTKLSPFDNNLLELGKHVSLYFALGNRFDPQAIPPRADGETWRSVGEIDRPFAEDLRARALFAALQKVRPGTQLEDLRDLIKDKKITDDEIDQIQAQAFDLFREAMTALGDKNRAKTSPAAEAFVNLFRLYRAGKYAEFNAAVTAYRADYVSQVPADTLGRVRFEALLNRADPMFQSMILYVFAFVLVSLSWVLTALRMDTGAVTLRRTALGMVAATAVVHFAVLISRMYLMDRWLVFVTNLYSSAVFIGWACAALGLVVELIFGRGLGTAVAAVIGGSTLVIAYFLGADGDTLHTLQAVLDTNFWLATHVTTVTLGYSATYFAGILGLAYVLLGVFTPHLTGEDRKALAQATYGVVCFATFLSFTGTVLGGIWADQSWGRFWGWDPKENGALLIVIWNALVLHARWGGLVKQRGVAVLAVFGCVVTTWSWFGTNQLGVGLHSYGFTTGRTIAIICASVGFTLLGGLGLLPLRFWRSTKAELARRPKKKADEIIDLELA